MNLLNIWRNLFRTKPYVSTENDGRYAVTVGGADYHFRISGDSRIRYAGPLKLKYTQPKDYEDARRAIEAVVRGRGN